MDGGRMGTSKVMIKVFVGNSSLFRRTFILLTVIPCEDKFSQISSSLTPSSSLHLMTHFDELRDACPHTPPSPTRGHAAADNLQTVMPGIHGWYVHPCTTVRFPHTQGSLGYDRRNPPLTCERPFIANQKERNVWFNDALNTFYLWLYGIGHMVKDHSDRERE